METINTAIMALVNQLSDADRRELVKQITTNQRNRKLLTSRQAAEILDCHPETVKRYARSGILNPIRIGKRKLRFDAAEIQNLHDFGNGGE